MKRCQEIFWKKIQVMTQHVKITIDMKLYITLYRGKNRCLEECLTKVLTLVISGDKKLNGLYCVCVFCHSTSITT